VIERRGASGSVADRGRVLTPAPTAALLCAFLLAGAADARAQALAPLQEGFRGDVGRVHVEARPASTVTALALALPVGSALDPEGREGTARILAGAVARRVEEVLGAAGGVVRVEVTPYRTSITVLATSDHWNDAARSLLRAAFGEAPDAASVAAEVGGLLEGLTFEAGAPIQDVRRETARLLHGGSETASRAPGGTAEGLAALTAEDVAAFRSAHYRATEAALSVVGVDDRREALASLGVSVAEVEPDSARAAAADTAAGPPAADSLAPSPAPTDSATRPPSLAFQGALPWSRADRVRIAPDVTSTWIAVAYPVPDDLPATLLEFVSHRLGEELNPSPSDPGLFSARVAVRTLPGGRVLLVEAAVLPDAADRWEARIPAALAALTEPVDEAFFRWQRRRFRAATLLAEASPETAAARHASDLLTLGGVRRLAEAVWALDAATLAAGVAALGPPRVLVFGPDLAGSGPGPDR
jgi:predicted Zn-dependent peptidase